MITKVKGNLKRNPLELSARGSSFVWENGERETVKLKSLFRLTLLSGSLSEAAFYSALPRADVFFLKRVKNA